MTLVAAIFIMTATGLVLGSVIGLFAGLFRIEPDRRIELVTELLPGVNCGGCGRAGCADFARALVNGEAKPGDCPVCSREAASAIAAALGIEPGGTFRQVAVVRCGGSRARTMGGSLYNGVADCVSASLVAGGPKGCEYGCLGMSSCARSCPFGAIEMKDELAVVHNELCVGCGVCVAKCPRRLIALVPAEAAVHVYCNSPLKAPQKKRCCLVPCIGCRKCLKAAPGQFKIAGFLAAVDYDAETLPGIEAVAAADCPTGCLHGAEKGEAS